MVRSSCPLLALSESGSWLFSILPSVFLLMIWSIWKASMSYLSLPSLQSREHYLVHNGSLPICSIYFSSCFLFTHCLYSLFFMPSNWVSSGHSHFYNCALGFSWWFTDGFLPQLPQLSMFGFPGSLALLLNFGNPSKPHRYNLVAQGTFPTIASFTPFHLPAFVLRFLVANLFPHASAWPHQLIPSCHCCCRTALGCGFYFSSALQLLLALLPLHLFQPKCKSPSSIPQVLAGAPRLTVLLTGRGIMSSTDLAISSFHVSIQNPV